MPILLRRASETSTDSTNTVGRRIGMHVEMANLFSKQDKKIDYEQDQRSLYAPMSNLHPIKPIINWAVTE